MLLNLLHHWPSCGYPLLVVKQARGPLLERVPPAIEVLTLDAPLSGRLNFAVTIVKLAVLMARRRPAAIVSYHTSQSLPVVFASKLGSANTKVVVGVNEYPFFIHYSRGIRQCISKFGCKLIDCFWVLNDRIAEDMLTRGIPKRKIRIIPISVDLDLIDAAKQMPVEHPAFKNTEAPIIITACRLSAIKRLDILLQASALLASKTAFRLVILGQDQENLTEKLRNLATNLGIGDRTYFLGFHSNPWKFISKADVFVLSSDHEAMPNVLVEAMACRTPVVSTRAPVGPESIIVDEESGLLVERRNPQALANGILRLLTNQELRERCVKGGVKLRRRLYS